jgi:hypothetical protein
MVTAVRYEFDPEFTRSTDKTLLLLGCVAIHGLEIGACPRLKAQAHITTRSALQDRSVGI